jgi:hypothetical protein
MTHTQQRTCSTLNTLRLSFCLVLKDRVFVGFDVSKDVSILLALVPAGAHPALERVPGRMHLAEPFPVALDDAVAPAAPPAREILSPLDTIRVALLLVLGGQRLPGLESATLNVWSCS